MEVLKQDWKLFREKISGWQELYMDRLNQEYISILTGEGNPSDKFWALEKRIRDDKRSRGVVIQMSKQNMVYDISALIYEGVITMSDIEDFSEELKELVRYLCSIER